MTITFNQRSRPHLIFRKNPHLTGLPDMPFSLYGYGRVNSMDPAMSICAHRIGTSPPSLASMPSTKAFKNNAAVQLPPGLPPVCSYPISAAVRRIKTGPELFSRCTDQRWTNKSEARTLHPAACARTCHTRSRPPRTIRSIKNLKSANN